MKSSDGLRTSMGPMYFNGGIYLLCTSKRALDVNVNRNEGLLTSTGAYTLKSREGLFEQQPNNEGLRTSTGPSYWAFVQLCTSKRAM